MLMPLTCQRHEHASRWHTPLPSIIRSKTWRRRKVGMLEHPAAIFLGPGVALGICNRAAHRVLMTWSGGVPSPIS